MVVRQVIVAMVSAVCGAIVAYMFTREAYMFTLAGLGSNRVEFREAQR